MTSLPRTLRLFASALILPVFAAPAVAAGATTHHARPRAVPSKPVGADNSIIALPLNPVVPAAQRACAMRTPSGLGYTMLRAGPGARPAASDVVLVNYIGYLAASGVVFDQGMRSPLQVDGVIPGFAQGLQMIGRGGIVRLCIPAALGYGAQASGPIPPNADLVFQVELVDFKTAAEVETMRKAQAADPAAAKGTTPAQ